MIGRRFAGVVRSRILFGVGGDAVPNQGGSQSGERTTLADARQAFLDGEFERCLVLCDAVRARKDSARFELAVLQARVHVRLDRGDRALEALRAVEFSALSIDQYVTAKTLTGAAYVRVGQKTRGYEILAEVEESAAGAHPTVRSELLLQLAIAKFRLGANTEADHLLSRIDADQDIVYAHAVEYRGWVAQARGEFETAAGWFRAALSALTTCRQRDRYVEAKSLYGLAALAPELLLTDDWNSAEPRLRAFNWSASGLTPWRFWTNIAASMMSEMTGDVVSARVWARHAETHADCEGYRVVALCRMAAVFRGHRELTAHAEFVERALETYHAMDLRKLGTDVQQLPLYLAEEVAHTSSRAQAGSLLAQYREVIRPALKSSSGDSDRYDAMESYIEALLFEARGESARAVRAFSVAFRVLASFGYRRRATMVALRLARLTGKRRYVEYAGSALHGVSDRFWMARDLRELQPPGTPGITDTEQAILRLLVRGKTYKEIGASRKTSWKTVGNHVSSSVSQVWRKQPRRACRGSDASGPRDRSWRDPTRGDGVGHLARCAAALRMVHNATGTCIGSSGTGYQCQRLRLRRPRQASLRSTGVVPFAADGHVADHFGEHAPVCSPTPRGWSASRQILKFLIYRARTAA